MERPGGESSEVNVHVAWRMALAERAAQAYGRNEQLAETVLLAETHTDAEIGSFREDLAERRRAIDPPPPDQ